MNEQEKRTTASDLYLNPQAVVNAPIAATPLTQLSYKAEDVLYEIGFEAGDDLTDVSLVDIVAVPGGGPNVVKEIFDLRQRQLNNDISIRFSPEDERRIRDIILKGMRVRAQNVLTNLNPETVADFVKLRWETIFNARSCGRETFDQILSTQNRVRDILNQYPDISAEELIQRIAALSDGVNLYPDFSSLRKSRA